MDAAHILHFLHLVGLFEELLDNKVAVLVVDEVGDVVHTLSCDLLALVISCENDALLDNLTATFFSAQKRKVF